MEEIETAIARPSRRVIFDVRGQLFATSFESLKNVNCMLSRLADPESKFLTKEPDGVIFINRNSKYFPIILEIVNNPNTSEFWPLPANVQDCQELLAEADFYSLPHEIIDALKKKISEKEDEVQKQITELTLQVQTLKKEKETVSNQLLQEVREKSEIKSLLNDSQLQTSGCYVSISEFPFAMRISKDFTRIQWAPSRSVERIQIKSGFVGHMNANNAHYNGYEVRPVSFQEANIVLTNASKSYALCERRIDNPNVKDVSMISTMRIDLCCMGNYELLIIFENSNENIRNNSDSPKLGKEKNTNALEDNAFKVPYYRIICRFQHDNR